MEKNWIHLINKVLIGLIALCIFMSLTYLLIKPQTQDLSEEVTPVKKPLPKGAFTQSIESYNKIPETIFRLKYSPMTMQLPDLRKHLIFYGRNDRPDAKNDQTMLHFGFVGNKKLTSILPNTKTYVVYDGAATPPQYIFTTDNQSSPLWIEATAIDKEATVKVRMMNEEGQIIDEPWSHAEFKLIQRDFLRQATPWMLGEWRVDGSLLARQKAKWYGLDKFMENHGGEEFKSLQNKQRIDFGEGENAYSIYTNIGDPLLWKNDRWQELKPNESSANYPLLSIKKIDDRLMQFELFDVNGQGKVILNMLKSLEPWTKEAILQNFKFLGSRTRSQFVFEVDKERMLLSPNDWLVLTPKGWIKLDSAKLIDEYVNRQIVGTLFIFEGVIKKNDEQYLKGLLYNPSRSEVIAIDMLISPSGASKNSSDKKKKSFLEDSEDDDDDDDNEAPNLPNAPHPPLDGVSYSILPGPLPYTPPNSDVTIQLKQNY